MAFKENLKKYRKAAGLTQQQLADKCFLAKGTIQQYEAGKREPSGLRRTKLAAALGISETELLYDMKLNDYLRREFPDSYDKYSIEKLTENYNSANSAGKKKIVEYSEDIIKIKEYRKEQ